MEEEKAQNLFTACIKGDKAEVERALVDGASPHTPILETNKATLLAMCQLFRKYDMMQQVNKETPQRKADPVIDEDEHFVMHRFSTPEGSDPEVPLDCETKYKLDREDPFQKLKDNYPHMDLRCQNIFFTPGSDEERWEEFSVRIKEKAQVYKYRFKYTKKSKDDNGLKSKCILLRTLDRQDLIEKILLLLQHSIHKDETKQEFENCFHIVAETQCQELVKKFLDLGLDVNIKDKYQNTVLHRLLETTKENDPYDLVVAVSDRIENINHVNHRGFTPLHLAVLNLYTESVKYLVNEKRANVNSVAHDKKDTDRPLFMLLDRYWLNYYKHDVHKQHILDKIEELSRFLLDSRAEVRGAKGNTIFHLTFLSRLPKLWEDIQPKHSQFLNEPNDHGRTPLHMCYISDIEYYEFEKNVCFFNHVKNLMECGAELKMKDKNNKTPMDLINALLRNAQKQMMDILGTPGGHIYSDEAAPMMFHYLPAHIQHILLFLSAGLDLSKLEDHVHIQFQYPFFRLTRVKMFYHYFHVYGAPIREMSKGSLVINELQTEVMVEVRQLKHISAQIVRQNLFPNAYYGVKHLNVPQSLIKQITPDPVQYDDIKADLMTYRELMLDWRTLMNY